MPIVIIIQKYLMDGPFNAWCVDSSETSQIYHIQQGFKKTQWMNERVMILKMGTSDIVAATAI